MLLRLIAWFCLILAFSWSYASTGCNPETCVNGKCESGVCKCSSCYTGPTCELIKNKAPTFEKSNYEVTINPALPPSNVLVRVQAFDEDKCLDLNCGCRQIVYSLMEDTTKDAYVIDENSGEIRLVQDKVSLPDLPTSFVVKATNKGPFDNTYDTSTVFINLTNQEETILERHRRAAVPPEISFSLTQTFPTKNLTSVSSGQRLSFRVLITFPSGTSQINLELFASETPSEPVFMICDANIKLSGSNLKNTSSLDIQKQTGANGTLWPYTHIVFKSITVVNSQSTQVSDLTTIQATVQFNAVVLGPLSIQDRSTHYISAGAEYLNGTRIWVGQVAYSVQKTPITPPTIQATGDDLIYPGRTAEFNINIKSFSGFFYLNLGIYTPQNNSAALSLCMVNRNIVGAAYSCLPTTYKQPELTGKFINNQMFYTNADMAVGPLGNRLYMENQYNDSVFTINIKVVARINPLLWVNNMYYIGYSLKYSESMTTGSVSFLAAKYVANKLYSLPISYTTNALDKSVSIGNSGHIILSITIPKGTDLDYTITAKFTGQEAEICGMSFYSAGLNIPCVDQVIFNTSFVMTNNYAYQASSVITSIRHVETTNNPADDVLQIKITFRPINSTKNFAGKKITGSVMVEWLGGKGSELTTSFDLIDPLVTSVNMSNLPTFQFNLKSNNGDVTVGESYQLYFSIRLQPGITYAPVTLSFYMPFDKSAQVGMCSVDVNFVGKNVLCFNPTFLKSKFEFSSKSGDKVNFDQLQLNVGSMCTAGPEKRVATIDDEIQLTISIIIMPHPSNTIGATASLNAGMMISPAQIWVGTQPLKFVAKPTMAPLSNQNFPQIVGKRIDYHNNNIWLNDIVIMQYIIKTAPSLWTDMSLTVSSDLPSNTPDTFSVCQIQIKSKGASIPCVNGTMTNTTWTPFSKFNKQSVFKFTSIFNSGTTPLGNEKTAFDDNSILVEVIVKFGHEIYTVTSLKTLLTFNGGEVPFNTDFSLQQTGSRFNGTIERTEPIFKMSLSPLFNNTSPNISTIAYSEALRGILSIKLKPNTLQSLRIFMASAPETTRQMDIVTVNILFVGRNIPCLQKGMISSEPQKRSGSTSTDMGSIELGTVCNQQLPNTTAEDDDIIIEAIFRVWQYPKSYPRSVQLNSIALLNNDQVYISRIIIDTSLSTDHIQDINILNQDLTVNVTAIPPDVRIGDIFTLNVSVSVPPYSQFKSGKVILYSENPVGSDSFYFVGINPNFTGKFGVNLGINSKEPLIMTLKSSRNTSQLDYICADLGVVQNTATNYRMNQNNYTSPTGDDSFWILIQARLTDNSMASDGKIISVNVGADFGSIKKNSTVTIKVIRLNNEGIELDLNTSLLSSKEFYTSSDPIMVSLQAIMLNASRLECRNFTIYISTPPFILLAQVVNSSYSSAGYAIEKKVLPQGGFYFTVPYFFYNESLFITFTMSVIPSLNLTRGRSKSDITVPVIYTCQTLNWPANPLGNKLFNKDQALVFTVQGNKQPDMIKGCNDDLKLWDSNVIKDCAISAFKSLRPRYDHLKIRRTNDDYWAPFVRGGQYGKLRYIDIKFGRLTTVSKIVVQCGSPNLPRILSVYGTMDGRVFTPYEDKSGPLTFETENASFILSQPPFSYRGIRIAITNTINDDEETGLKMDLFGCVTQNVTDTKMFDPCAVQSFNNPINRVPEYYDRGYVYSSSQIFVCDIITSRSKSLDYYSRCFRSTTRDPTVWEDLGHQVGKIIGYDRSTSIIYGISADMKGYIMSEDNGLTWSALNGGGWRMARALGNVDVFVEVLWDKSASFKLNENANPCSKYSAGSFNICYDGIYFGSTNVFNWNNCCTV